MVRTAVTTTAAVPYDVLRFEFVHEHRAPDLILRAFLQVPSGLCVAGIIGRGKGVVLPCTSKQPSKGTGEPRRAKRASICRSFQTLTLLPAAYGPLPIVSCRERVEPSRQHISYKTLFSIFSICYVSQYFFPRTFKIATRSKQQSSQKRGR